MREHFKNILNSQHQNLKFAIEKATQSLTFLDVEINILGSGVLNLVWRKLSHTGLLLNFKTVCTKTSKSCLILGLLHRPKLIFSSVILCYKEVKKLTEYIFT